MGEVIVDRPAEAVARLTISNPEKRNALDHPVLDAITANLGELADGIETRCVIITGAPPVFSAGYDIGGIPDESFERDAEALVAHPFAAAMEAITAHPYPVVAAINGHCLGGALELAVRCDFRVCAAGAKLGMPPAKLGLIYGHTGLQRFIDVVGVARTKELFLVGATHNAVDAARMVNDVTADEDLENVAVAVAGEIAGNAPLSMKGNKHAIEVLARNPVLSEEQERELVELRESCFASEDFREGIRAFGEKRKPQWRGL
jgi:enoyl-CoA hydratase/carnithine racemase